MKQIFIYVSIISFTLLVTSCRQELKDLEPMKDSYSHISEGAVVNGRLYFSSIEALRYAYDNVKNEEDEVIADYIDNKANFLSLKPIVTSKNEHLLAIKMEEKIKYLKNNERLLSAKRVSVLSEEDIKEDLDDIEEIIGDDAYAAFLNSDAEIQVADKIYKYTDVGLFIVKDDKYSKLKEYLSVQKISDNLLYSTDEVVKNNYISSYAPKESNKTTPIDIDIKYFTMPIYDDEDEKLIDVVVNPTPPVTSKPTPISIPKDHIQDFIDTLPNCSPRKGLFGDIFGQNQVCINKYESKRRIKLKSFNYNYYLVYHTGVKLKHQYKGWTGLWRKEKAEELRLGVKSATFYYDYKEQFQTKPPSNRITTIYNNDSRLIFDANVKWEPGFYPNAYTITRYSMQGYPKILQDDIYIEDILGIDIGSNNSIIDKGLYNAVKQGNKYLSSYYISKKFWDESIKYLAKTWIKLGRQAPNNNITYSLSIPELGVINILKTFYRTEYNVSKVDKTFDWGFSVGININSNGSISSGGLGKGLKKPKDFRTDLYGLVKKNGTWQGIRMNTL